MEATFARLPFVVDDAQLMDIHRVWIRGLVARLHTRRIVAERPASDVRDIYRTVAEQQPELRRVLDDNFDAPALAEPLRREYSMLASIAGLAPEGTDIDTAAERGRALVTSVVPVQRLAAS